MKKTMISISLILVVLIGACTTNKEQKVTLLEAVDSLGWQQDNNYIISQPSFISVIDDLLFIADDSHEIKIYETDSMNFIKKFGGHGSAPGEFQLPNSILKFDDGYIVSDMINGRLQYFDNELNYIKSTKQFAPFQLLGDMSSNFVCTHPLFPGAAIIRFDNEPLTKAVNLDSLYKQNNIQENREKVIDALYYNGKIVLSFIENSFLLVIDGNKRTRLDYQLVEGMNPAYVTHNYPHLTEDGLIVMVTDVVNPDKQNPVIKYSLIKYNWNGEILNIFRLPEKILFPFTWGFDGEHAYIYDMDSGRVYKYRIT